MHFRNHPSADLLHQLSESASKIGAEPPARGINSGRMHPEAWAFSHPKKRRGQWGLSAQECTLIGSHPQESGAFDVCFSETQVLAGSQRSIHVHQDQGEGSTLQPIAFYSLETTLPETWISFLASGQQLAMCGSLQSCGFGEDCSLRPYTKLTD